MSRKGVKRRRAYQPDHYFNNVEVRRFVSMMMWDGKYAKSHKIFRDAMALVCSEQSAQYVKKDDQGKKDLVVECFDQIVEAIRPHVGVKSKRIGGATYQVPEAISNDKGRLLAFKLLIKHARIRNGADMSVRLSREMMEALQGRGGAFGERETMHRMAKANQAYAQ